MWLTVMCLFQSWILAPTVWRRGEGHFKCLLPWPRCLVVEIILVNKKYILLYWWSVPGRKIYSICEQEMEGTNLLYSNLNQEFAFNLPLVFLKQLPSLRLLWCFLISSYWCNGLTAPDQNMTEWGEMSLMEKDWHLLELKYIKHKMWTSLFF